MRAIAAEKSRERTLRNQARRLGLVLRKDRARAVSVDHLGGYMLVEGHHGYPVAGERFGLTLDQAAGWLDKQERRVAESRAVS